MFLADVLGIAYLELQYINELLEVIADNKLGYTIRKELADQPLSQVDSNTLIFSIFYHINRDVFSQIKKQLENDTIEVSNEAEKEKLFNRCEKRIGFFAPSINAIDSHFNNELDDVTIRGNTRNKIVDEVISLLLEKIRS